MPPLLRGADLGNQTKGGSTHFAFRTKGYILPRIFYQMGYTKPIETENAIYILSLERHDRPDYSVFEKYTPDAVIAERAMNIDPKKSKSLEEAPWVKNILSRTNAPVYGVDPSFKVEDPLRGGFIRFQTSMMIGAAGIFFIAKGLLKKGEVFPLTLSGVGSGLMLASEILYPKLHNLTRGRLSKSGPVNIENFRVRISDLLQKWAAPIVVDGRNALFAEKVDGYIARYLRSKLKRKPVIVIQVGEHHTGIRTYLLRKDRRRKTLRKLSNKIKQAFVHEDLDRSYRIDWDPVHSDYAINVLKTPVSKRLHSQGVRVQSKPTISRKMRSVRLRR